MKSIILKGFERIITRLQTRYIIKQTNEKYCFKRFEKVTGNDENLVQR